MSTHTTFNHIETEQLGYQLASFLDYQTYPVILLDGPLAAGKTTFTKGIARALDIKRNINSPSYTLMKIYESEDQLKTLYHFDLYRMDSSSQDYDLEEYMNSEAFVVIEWPFQVQHLIPESYIKVTFHIVNETERKIEITCHASYCKHLELEK